MTLTVVCNEADGGKTVFDGPPPTLQTGPRTSFPEDLEGRPLPAHHPGNAKPKQSATRLRPSGHRKEAQTKPPHPPGGRMGRFF